MEQNSSPQAFHKNFSLSSQRIQMKEKKYSVNQRALMVFLY